MFSKLVQHTREHWPVRHPMPNCIMLILLTGWIVPTAPDIAHDTIDALEFLWIWLSSTASGELSSSTNAEKIRNISLGLGGPFAAFALWLAWRRTTDARRQTETQIEQSKTQIRQAKNAERDHENERFQTAISMLGSGNLVLEIVALETLSQLSSENPNTYRLPIRRILSNCVSNSIKNENDRVELIKLNRINENRIWEILIYDMHDPTPNNDNVVFFNNSRCPEFTIFLNKIPNSAFYTCELQTLYLSKKIINVSFSNCKIERLVLDMHFVVFVGISYIFYDCKFEKIAIRNSAKMNANELSELFFACNDSNGREIDRDFFENLLKNSPSIKK